MTGAAGLAYELVWTRWLELLLGSTTYAATAVLAAFMGGLALGGALFGRIADWTSRHLTLYGWIEIAVGFYGIAFPALLSACTRLYVTLAQPLPAKPVLTFALRFGIALLLVLVPTTLMGGTLPVLVRHLASRPGRIGRGVAWLYFINSAGAVAGCLTAGFFTIGRFGLLFTSTLAVAINIAAGVGALLLRRRGEAPRASVDRSQELPVSPDVMPSAPLASTPSRSVVAVSETSGAFPSVPVHSVTAVVEKKCGFGDVGQGADSRLSSVIRPQALGVGSRAGMVRVPGAPEERGPSPGRLALAALLSGTAAMAYEIAWFRLLALVLGSSSDAFTLMLATFIGGLALGSLFAASAIDRLPSPARTLFRVQAAIGLSVLATLPMARLLPELSLHLRGMALGSYAIYQVLQAVVCALLLAVPTFLLGVSFPLFAKLASGASRARNTIPPEGIPRLSNEREGHATERMRGIGRRFGGIVAWTTTGNIAGALLAGLVLIPLVGARGTASLAAFVSLASAFAVAPSFRAARGSSPSFLAGRPVRFAALLAATAVLALYAPRWNVALLTSAPFRLNEISGDTLSRFRQGLREREVVFFREDAGATVSVERRGANLILRVNGKPDASLALEDMLTQRLLGHYPMLFHPDPRRVMIVGLGSGITAGAVLQHPIEALTVAEISSGVVEASRLFEQANHAYWRDPRLRLRVEDARNVLLVEPGQYDVVISEPSNLWMAGVASLYTRDFYELVRRRLRPCGILVQWVHSYEMEEEDFTLVLRTILSVFPHATVFRSSPGDLQILASMEPFDWNFPRVAARLEGDGVREDFGPLGIADLYTLLTNQEIPEEDLAAYAGEGSIHVDDWPVLEKRTPRSLFRNARVVLPELSLRIGSPHTLLNRYLAGRRPTARERLHFAEASAQLGIANNLVTSALEAAIQDDPGFAPPYRLLAATLARRDRYEEAARWMERLTQAGDPEAKATPTGSAHNGASHAGPARSHSDRAEDYFFLAGYELEAARRRVGFSVPFDASRAVAALDRCAALAPEREDCRRERDALLAASGRPLRISGSLRAADAPDRPAGGSGPRPQR